VDGSDIRLVAELPYETDVRRVVEAITADAPYVEAVGQRTVPRRGKTVGTLRTTVEDRLTDKQRAALEAAYFAGYFGHTRESTGNEVAESLGVTPSTFHQHLQVGLEKVLSSLFESR
jgi:predicted DNA binding protein